MSILHHEAWPAIRPYVILEFYERDTTSKGPRHRVEVRAPTHQQAVAWSRLTAPCVACGNITEPFRFRARERGRRIFYACSCHKLGCCRGTAARQEYDAIEADVKAHAGDPKPTGPQHDLFEAR
jgi:hypothetical protein